jgi:ABC-type Fe3+/spermidine/putrescine transport system ATPase subunit
MSLNVTGLKKTFGEFSVSLDFNVDPGETLALVGPSGSGKTTALHLVAGLSMPDSGKVISNKEDISALPCHQRNISLVFQDLALFPHLDVGGNIAYGLVIRKVPRKERLRIINENLELVRLNGYASRRIHTLSGGERQRVAIARALASKPRALLLDEPFSSLDLPLRKKLRREFLEIRSRSNAPCIFVTHDREEAALLGNRLALMNEGRIVECGTGRDLFLAPKTEFAARFFGAGQVLPCRVLRTGSDGLEVSTPLGKLTVPNFETDLKQEQAKIFVPHDAISFQNRGGAFKSFNARFSNAFFEGARTTVKLFLAPWEDLNEEIEFELSTDARMKTPSPGDTINEGGGRSFNSTLTLWVDQSLVSFVS